MWRVCGRGEGCTWFWWGNLKGIGQWGDPDVDMMIILRWMFRKLEGVVVTCGTCHCKILFLLGLFSLKAAADSD
jgi:hypothetical protein